jgi:gamma-glutamyltranspeptidase/glutathione hydrolase
VLGSAGSERLRGALLQVILNVVDRGLDIEQAIGRPRVHLDGDTLHVEPGVSADALRPIEHDGLAIERWSERNFYFGGVSAVAVRTDGALEAAGDPRRGGVGLVVA